jgi:hypothetical protein
MGRRLLVLPVREPDDLPGVKRSLALVLIALLPSCGVSGLNFVQDERVSIVSPKDRATVSLPVTVRWTAHDVEESYAVFVDRAPVPGGKTLDWLAREDDLCSSTPGCPSDAWFADRQVFRTSGTELTLHELPELDRQERRELHEVIVVLLDRQGRRVGESAFSVEFELDKSPSGSLSGNQSPSGSLSGNQSPSG